MPESIEEWYEVLTAFKNEMGAESPLCVSWSDLSGSTLANAFGVAAKEWYIDSEGKVVYGAVTDEYKNFLITMKQWYAEGLLDVDMASLKSDNVTSKMVLIQSPDMADSVLRLPDVFLSAVIVKM